MKEGEGIRRWLAIVIIIITIAIILAAIFLPFLIDKVKSDEKNDTEFYIDFQIGNPVAVISLPPRLTEFKQNRDLVKVSLVGVPFMNDGQIMIAIRDLENLFPSQVLWNSKNRTIKVSIPSGIISKSQLVFTLTDKDFILRNNRAFISIRDLGKILKVSEIVFTVETESFRLIWDIN